MLAKKTSKNQLTLPKAVIANDPDVDYFDVRDEDGRILLIPMRPNRADRVRGKLEQVGISDQDVDAAVRWARGVDSGTGEDGYGLLRCERPGERWLADFDALGVSWQQGRHVS